MMIETKCKLCGVRLEAGADADCPEEWVRVFVPMLCCNRCGDYRDWMRRACYKVRGVCREWSTMAQKRRDGARGSVYKQLEDLTKRIAEAVCRFHRKQTQWDPDFVEQLLEQPHKSDLIIRAYDSGVRRL